MNDHERKMAVVKHKLEHALGRANRAEDQLAAERERADALAAFAREAFATAFDGGTWDGADIQKKGAELGLLREEPFDPEKHPGVDATDFEPGETIYVFTELMEGSGA